jgi:hypothetical protein
MKLSPQIHAAMFLRQGKGPRYSLDRRLGESNSRCGRVAQTKNLFALHQSNPHSLNAKPQRTDYTSPQCTHRPILSGVAGATDSPTGSLIRRNPSPKSPQLVSA